MNLDNLVQNMSKVWNATLASSYRSGSGEPLGTPTCSVFVKVDGAYRKVNSFGTDKVGVILETEPPKTYDELETEFAEKGL